MSYFAGVALFALGIAITIGLHEWGHYSVARACGMRVRRFFIGFGPTLFQFTRGHTTYGFKAVPLGGFCDIAGMTAVDEITPEEKPYAMVDKPWWARVATLLGGVAMNIVVGMLVLYVVAVSAGLPNPKADFTATVAETTCVTPGCTDEGPAAAAGIKAGDRILAVDGVPAQSFMDVRKVIIEKPGQDVVLDVERAGSVTPVTVAVPSVERETQDGQKVTVGAIGIVSAPPKDAIKQYGLIDALPATASFTGNMLGATVQGLASLPAQVPGVLASIFGAERADTSPMSVVGASRVGGEMVERAQWATFLMMLASLNFFLALFNLIPLPPLDGGHIAVVLWEKLRDWVRGLRGLQPAGPADYTKLMPLTVVMTGTLLVLGVIVILADIVNPVRLFG
ncbi:M50 family metallopeptidase [Corynebacterium hindlerae]|uniref:M50 family metallopeptidase n=1 Tax=Corynebacterium hindlerae TaxID=699041 RepID=UPI0031B6EDA6